jgi:hypothetical protein
MAKADGKKRRLLRTLDGFALGVPVTMFFAVRASRLPWRMIGWVEERNPQHPLPYRLVEPYGSWIAFASVAVVACLAVARLSLSRRHWYFPLVAVALAVWLMRLVRMSFVFG